MSKEKVKEYFKKKEYTEQNAYSHDSLLSFANEYASQECKEAEKKAYIDGTNACHKAFRPLLKSALKEQRELCAKAVPARMNIPINIKISVRNAPSPNLIQ